MPPAVDQVRAAATGLRAAAPPLSEGQRAALEAVAAAGEAEAAASATFAEAAGRGWPAYTALDEVQATWLQQVGAGRFRTPQEAAGAYVVARRPVVAPLQEARGLLATADQALRQAEARVVQALATADDALAPLRGPAS